MSKFIIPTLLCTLLLISVQSFSQQSSPTAQELKTKWQNLQEYALEIAELMPADSYEFKPTAEQMSFQKQLIHMANNIKKLSYAYLLQEEAPKEAAMNLDSKASVIRMLHDAFQVGLRAQMALSESQLKEQVSFFAGPMTRRQIRTLLHAHQVHHLGQLVVYLRLKGITPPRYVGW